MGDASGGNETASSQRTTRRRRDRQRRAGDAKKQTYRCRGRVRGEVAVTPQNDLPYRGIHGARAPAVRPPPRPPRQASRGLALSLRLNSPIDHHSEAAAPCLSPLPRPCPPRLLLSLRALSLHLSSHLPTRAPRITPWSQPTPDRVHLELINPSRPCVPAIGSNSPGANHLPCAGPIRAQRSGSGRRSRCSICSRDVRTTGLSLSSVFRLPRPRSGTHPALPVSAADTFHGPTRAPLRAQVIRRSPYPSLAPAHSSRCLRWRGSCCAFLL